MIQSNYLSLREDHNIIRKVPSHTKSVFGKIKQFVKESPLSIIVLVVASVAAIFLPLGITLPFIVASAALLIGRFVVKGLNKYNPNGAIQLKEKVHGFFRKLPYLLTIVFFASLGLSFLYLPVGLFLAGSVGLFKGFNLEINTVNYKQNQTLSYKDRYKKLNNHENLIKG